MVSSRLHVNLGSAVALAACALAFMGCGSDAAPVNPLVGGAGSGAGGGSGGTQSSAGTAGTNSAGQSATGAAGAFGGSAGAVGVSGSGGALGSAGASGSGGAGCVTMGTQSDPTATGDGKLYLAPASTNPIVYTPAPETLSHINGAPKGKVNGVEVGGTYTALLYAAKTQYPGLNAMLKYQYWIYVPAQYKAGCAAALMVWQDGLHYVGIDDAKFNAPTVLDNLINSGDMPVTIALFINPGEPGDGTYNGQEYGNRSAQYDRNNTNYANFLIDEFLPANVLGNYTIVTDPDGWGIGGHSSGGIAAFMAGWYRPEKFHKLLTHDASFPNTGDNMGISLQKSIETSAVKPLRVYLMSGPNDLEKPRWYDQNTAAATALAAKGYHYQYRTEDSDHYPPQAGASDFANALRWMWRGYKL